MLAVDLLGGRAVAPVADKEAMAAGAVEPAAGQVPALERVVYPDVWDGVTVAYEKASGGIVESSYRIAAGSGKRAVESIRIRYNRPVRIDTNGDLVITYDHGEMRESAPVAWQESNGAKIPVDASFRSFGADEIGFEIGGYDHAQPLIIDPVLTWNTFLGGSGSEVGFGIAVDGSGNVYVGGACTAAWGTSPIRAYTSDVDIFVAKLDSGGNLTWHTFLGGSGSDRGYGLTVDGSGNVYIGGESNAAWGEPKRAFTSGGYDAFAAKLDSGGDLTWNTFLGGSGTDGGNGMAVDGSGNVYVGGQSTATWGVSPIRAFTSNGECTDAFAAKLDSGGDLTWNTFLGGIYSDLGKGIAVDGSGNVYVGGESTATWGTSPIRAFTSCSEYSSCDDAFAAKLDSGGNLTWNTFLGGGGGDGGYGLAVDGSGNVYVAGFSGTTWGTPKRAFTVTVNDAFAAKLDSGGNLTWNTFLGGSGDDYGQGIAVDGSGNVYIGGYGYGTWGSPIRAYTSGGDALAAKIDSGGNLTWNTFLGGSGSDRGLGIAVDGSGNIYVGGFSNATWGTSPIRAYTSGYDAFAAKMPETPTGIGLISFQAAARRDAIDLTWQTAMEPDNAGFHLWRAEGTDQPYERITSVLIPARGDAVNGATYAYADCNVVLGRNYLYRLADIDLNGESSFHGPVFSVMGTIDLLGPTDGMQTIGRFPVCFSWDGGPFVSFQVEISSAPDLSAATMILPADWIAASSYQPGKSDWNKIRALAGADGIIYWRVRGRTAGGAESISDRRWLRVRS
ncbi:MAG: SBBP repeat-containing protein [Acidobacteriota bacterium]|nr:SBBP repeat-containing protein [Acidobacteriota bacterium]